MITLKDSVATAITLSTLGSNKKKKWVLQMISLCLVVLGVR